MFREFLADRRGNYAMMTVICMLPLMGGLAVAIDYAEMTRERSLALNALDTAGIATARAYSAGMAETSLQAYAEEFFKANSNGVEFKTLTLVMPNNNTGGGTMKLKADMTYDPYFLPALTSLLGKNAVSEIAFAATTEIRLKNTLEVALVLDNSRSMLEEGGTTNEVRMDILKEAAKELVANLAGDAGKMKQVNKPVQFSVVPFAASVNIGPANATETWMDLDGVSPIHHENFDWTTMTGNKRVEKVGGVYYKKGTGWGTQENQKVTRFTLYNDVLRQTYTCTRTGWNGSCSQGSWGTPYVPFASWKGCVEARPNPYHIDDTAPSGATPATLFVPMYGPDESGNTSSYNNWFADGSGGTDLDRQKYMPKYFPSTPPQSTGEYVRSNDYVIVGPNHSCTTTAITPLTDVSDAAGKTAIDAAIDAMQADGATNVPEGMAWGWRTVSSGAPFTGGRPEAEKGNDKVVIVVTDGKNTYYTPGSLGYSDAAGNKSIYSSLGYAKLVTPGYTTQTGRIFQGTSSAISKSNFDNGNYTAAMNEHFKTLCDNAKAKKIIVMTVALDLDNQKTDEKVQIDALKACASNSRFYTEADSVTPKKLFWNSTGNTLEDDFKDIGKELSNLRIVG